MLEEANKEETTPQEPSLPQESFLLTIPQASKLLNLGRTTLYRLIDQEGLPVMRFGRSVRVNPARLREWLEQREQLSLYE